MRQGWSRRTGLSPPRAVGRLHGEVGYLDDPQPAERYGTGRLRSGEVGLRPVLPSPVEREGDERPVALSMVSSGRSRSRWVAPDADIACASATLGGAG